ncbi:YqgE/AlgH family protein [Nitrospina watsonii]|uniref:UPF0301 protein NSPWAT_2737 n=1 Tax=Nitrospina watsonii TaxID=1323948 RepID=A0ABN8W671_9BACT|nr:YqgE/AlgH family protein [Nitrospina watsonii]CAI2719593.1 conserved protein of unknown function [Nitrospina watsonii]
MSEDSYGKGTFLIANPVLGDPNFSRTVVLLCDHNDEGSFGLVVNRKAGLMASDLFQQAEFLTGYDNEVFVGGPVQQSQVFYLVRSPQPIEGLDHICDGIHLGMSWEPLESVYLQLENPAENLRFYMGYSGWGGGQLAGEMEHRSWLTCDAKNDHIFGDPESNIWGRVVQSLGKEYEYLLTAPVDPRMN